MAKRCVNHNISFLFLIIIFSITLPAKIVFSQDLVVLQLILNKENKGEFFLILAPDNNIWIKREEFEKLGLQKGLGENTQFSDETYVSLKSIPGLEFQVNEEQVSLDITAAAHLFKTQGFDAFSKKGYDVKTTHDSSAFLNYSLHYDHQSDIPLLGLTGELGIGVQDYFGKSTFSYEKTEDHNKIVRLMTNLTANNREHSRTIIWGDVPATGVLGTGAILGGINISKDFSLDPYFLKYPSLNLSGALETPSDVEVYSDDSLVRKERLSPGNFSFNEVPATVGLGNARIVIKDVYGRERIISKPYYYTNRLLKKGLHEYSYSLGFIRNNLGIKNFSYRNPAFLGFHNVGITDQIKIGYAAEASKSLINISPAASILIPNAGVLDAVVAVSNASGESGISGFFNYSFQSKNIGASISLTSNSRKYSRLMVRPSDDKPRFQLSSAMGLGREKTGFLTVEWSSSEMYREGTLSRIGVSYNKALTKQITFFIRASETKDRETNTEVLSGINMYLGKDILGHMSYKDGNGPAVKKVGVQKSLPVGRGYGFKSDIEFRDRTYADTRFQYQGNTGIYELTFNNLTRHNGYSVFAAGGMGYIDKSIFFSKPVNDSFAKVKVDNIEGVRVYYYGNEAGRTNKKGELVITDLRSFHDNRIEIESRDIPINYSIDSITQFIFPPFRSGSVVTFDVNKMQAVVGTIYILEDAKEFPAEYKIVFIHVDDKVLKGAIGRDGEFYLENIPQGRHPAKILHKERACIFDIIIPDSEELLIDLGKIICEPEK